jgi:hypothetical protein
MGIFRPLRVVLFVYELVRLFLLTALASMLSPPLSFPWPVYAVPNALFPLMALFLLIHLPVYKVYLPLYLAGKLISLSALLGWFFFSGINFIETAIFDPESFITVMGSMAFFFLGDALSAAGAFWLDIRIKTPASITAERSL